MGYSKNACKRNVEIEGVSERVMFQKASAVSLPFAEGHFDAVVSNFVFHEVSDAEDKREVIREALLVVKKDGKFSFQDEFLFKQFYGNPDGLIAVVKSWGISKVEFVNTRDADLSTGFEIAISSRDNGHYCWREMRSTLSCPDIGC